MEKGNEATAGGPMVQQAANGGTPVAAAARTGPGAAGATPAATNPAPARGAGGGGGAQADQTKERDRATASWEETSTDPHTGREVRTERTWSSQDGWRESHGENYDAKTGEWLGGGGSGYDSSQQSDWAESEIKNPDGTTTESYRSERGHVSSDTTDAEGNVRSMERTNPDGSGHSATFDAEGNETSSREWGPGER